MRDLDELLDPTVSRRASAAARTPEFALVERRGRQRQRRARAMAVGAVVAVVGAASVVGTQVAQDRADTAPAEVPPGYDDPNGELERSVEAGRADLMGAGFGAGGTTVTIWRRVVDGEGDDLPEEQFGFSFAADGETLWSPFETPVEMQAYAASVATPLPDGGIVVTRLVWSARHSTPPLLVDANGIRALEIRTSPADLSGGEYEGFVSVVDRNTSRIYAVDRETASAAPVAELAGFQPVWMSYVNELVPTPDGGVWAVASQRTNLVHLASDGAVTRYPFEGGSYGLAVGDDGQAALLSSADGRKLQVTIVEDGRASSHVWSAPESLVDVMGVAVLPDGRLLVHAADTMLRSTDTNWRRVEDLGVVGIPRSARLDSFYLESADGRACLVPNRGDSDGPEPVAQAYCTVDGETWEPFDLTP